MPDDINAPDSPESPPSTDSARPEVKKTRKKPAKAGAEKADTPAAAKVKGETPQKAARPKPKTAAPKPAPQKPADSPAPENPFAAPKAVSAPPAPPPTARDSEYYVIRTIQKMAFNIQTPLSGYNERYVRRAMETGRDFVEDVGKGTREALGGVVEEGRRFVSKIPALENLAMRAAENASLERGQSHNPVPGGHLEILLDAIGKTVSAFNTAEFQKLLDAAVFIIGDLGLSALARIGGLVETGRSFISRAVIAETVSALAEERIKNAPQRLNLPGRDEILRLIEALDQFNRNADSRKTDTTE